MTRARVEIHPAPAGAGHARQHVITAPLDHTSSATPGQILQADANGLPVDAANTDAQVALAVGLAHAQGTDTALGAVGVKNPPVDADKPLYRDSTAADALVTSTWAQIKAFLKTYFDTLYAAIGLAHNRLHSITSILDHTSGATPGQILQGDANGLPVDATNTDAQVAAVVGLAHARQHAITDPLDHTSGATPGQVLQADANGLPVDATNTNADIADAVSKKHTQGTDTALGVVGVKNPPIDADKALYRDSTAADALVTSTWTQVKAFLKTYFDTIYGALGLAHVRLHAITSALDHSSVATPGKMLKADANGLPIDATNTDAEVSDAVTKRHTQGTDTALGAVGTKNPPIDADKSLYRDSAAGDALVTSTWTQIKAFLKTYFDTIYGAIALAHTRLHSITSALDHSSTATPGKILKADANGLPVDASNTDAEVSDAVAKKHTQGTDVALGAVGVKNPPIDADKALYRDSTAADALVTSTWTQIKAFLKTYFDTIYGAIALAHTRLHSITSTLDHSSGATPGQILKANANGLPVDATTTDLQVAAAVALAHARQHAITNALDHTSAATPGKMLKADANGLPVDGTNTDAEVADAITKKHTQGTDTALGAVGVKNPPIDADKALYRDSTAADALVTSTWTQVKAFLKTYFDTIYGAIASAHTRLHAITSALDHSSAATLGKMLKADANGLPVDATNTDAEVSDAVTKKHTQGTDVALGAVGVKNPPIDADKSLYRDSAAADALVTSTWTQIKAFLKTYFDTLYATLAHTHAQLHDRLHSITSALDHSSAATPGKILKADANGLPVDASNTDAEVADAVAKKHTQGTDTALGAVGVKNPPIDADKALYRDSTAGDALVTSTWTQIKAFLKTYFDTLYGALGLAHTRLHAITSVLDHSSAATPGKMLKADANGLPVDATNTNADVADAVAKRHTQGTDTALGAVGTKNPPIDADKVLQRDSAAGDALVTSTWTQIKAFLKTYWDTLYEALGSVATHAALTTGVHGAGAGTIAVTTTAAITLYVDAASGNDLNPGTSGSPKATIKGALDALPPIIAHTATICVRGQQNYPENNVALEFSRFTTLASIIIKVVNSSDANMYDAGLATGGGANYLDDSGGGWAVDQFNGAYIWIYAGTGVGQIRTISDTTATRITVSVNWTTNPDNTSYYVIGGGATLTGTAGYHIYISGKTVNIYGFNHTGATSYDIYITKFANAEVDYNYFPSSVNSIMIMGSSEGTALYNYMVASGFGITTQASTSTPRANVVNGATTGARLIYAGLAQMSSSAAWKNYFLTCTTGITIDSGSGCLTASSQTFSGCGTNISPASSTIVPQWYT